MSDYSKEASRAVIDASKARVIAGLATDFDLLDSTLRLMDYKEKMEFIAIVYNLTHKRLNLQ